MIKPTANSRFAKAGVWCFYDSEVLNSSFVHLMNCSAENPRLRKAANRYRQALQEGTLIQKEGDLYILFEKPQRGITPGQFAAWYLNDELIGSGIIAE
jgi:tRNA U34 2-thiouridine synthase MnmA/TrmU